MPCYSVIRRHAPLPVLIHPELETDDPSTARFLITTSSIGRRTPETPEAIRTCRASFRSRGARGGSTVRTNAALCTVQNKFADGYNGDQLRPDLCVDVAAVEIKLG